MRATCVRPALCLSVLLIPAAPVWAQYTDWSPPVNLGSTVNSAWIEETPFLSRDGLHLYFNSDRPGGFGGADIWVATRSSVDAPWGPPSNLGPAINTPDHESHPTLSVDGHLLFFDRMPAVPGGTYDMFWSRRRDKSDDFGWETAVNAGLCINSPANDSAMIFFEDEATGITVTYFNSNRSGNPDMYATVYDRNGGCQAVTQVADLNTPYVERNAAIRRDAREILFESTRPGSMGFDLWVATRGTSLDRWSIPANVSSLNSRFYDGRPTLSWDGTELYFFSNREGNFDLYVSTRDKLNED